MFSEEEQKAFKNVIITFQCHLPLKKMPDLVENWPLHLYASLSFCTEDNPAGHPLYKDKVTFGILTLDRDGVH